MSKAFNLASYDDVKAHAGITYDPIRGIGPVMPRLHQEEKVQAPERIDLFARWIADGYQP